jgi:c-di-GMP-binding flagellar brake protein YcgR
VHKLAHNCATIGAIFKIQLPEKPLAKAYARQYPRLSVSITIDYSVGEKAFRGAAKTLSGGGLFLSSVEGLEAGKEILLRFRPAKHLRAISAKAKILYVLPEKGAGAEFTEIAPEDRNTVLRLIHQKTRDRRLNPRSPLATQVQCDQCMSLAFSRDISLGGMFIETDDLLPVGSALTVRFNLEQREKVVTAAAQVTYCIEKMGMGIVFTEIGQEDCDAIRHYLESLPAVTSTDPAKTKTA